MSEFMSGTTPEMASDQEEVTEEQFEEIKKQVSGLSEGQKSDLIAQLHNPRAGQDERYLSVNNPEA